LRSKTTNRNAVVLAGLFSIKQPEISGAMVEDKLKSLKATGAERVVSADCGCLMNILGHAAWKDQQEGRKTPSLPGEHIASFLLRRTCQMSARDRILAKLNAAPVLPKAEPDVASWYETHRSQESAVDKASRFRSCIELAHAEVYAVTFGQLAAKALGSAVGQTDSQAARGARNAARPAGNRRTFAKRHRVPGLRRAD
jgi:hypothetical protein